MTHKTAYQIAAMKAQTFGVEVEMNNITRDRAARKVSELFGTYRYENTQIRNGYMTWSAWDTQGREWKFSRDVSINGCSSEQCEMVTPVLTYDDMELLQNVIRTLRKAGARSSQRRGCGVHIHIGGDGHTPKSIRNLVNIMACHEDQLLKAIEVGDYRRNRYCKTVDPDFLDRINTQKPDNMIDLGRCWYNGRIRSDHYDDSRYRMLNLHSYFNRYHTIEFRCFNFDNYNAETHRRGGLHAGQLKAMIQLCLAMSEMAKELRSASPKKQQTDNEAYAFRCWMLRLGFIGEEFKTAREYFMRNFTGNSAWR